MDYCLIIVTFYWDINMETPTGQEIIITSLKV